MLKTLYKKHFVPILGSYFFSTVFRALRKKHIPIFMLHRMEDIENGVTGHSPNFLREALSYFRRNGYSPITVDELVDCMHTGTSIPDKAIALTFDDGFYDQIDIAAPILQEFDWPATIYLISDFMDNQGWPWDYQVEYILRASCMNSANLKYMDENIVVKTSNDLEKNISIKQIRSLLKKQTTSKAKEFVSQLAFALEVPLSQQPPPSYRPITWDQARNWEKRGINFGPHSVQHSILLHQSDENSLYEILHSQKRLTEELSKPSSVFCYPTGRRDIDFGLREMRFVEEAGFKAAVATDTGYVNILQDTIADRLFSLNRFGFPDNLADLIQYCSWIERAKQIIRP